MIKVYIEPTDFSRNINIYIFDECHNGNRKQLVFKECHIKEVNKFESISEPSLFFQYPSSTDILQALAEALDKKNIKTENDFKIAGLLEATKAHLEDFRKLLFKKEGIK